MNTILRNIIAVVAGFLAGGLVNFGLISISGSVVPPPPGADLKTAEGLRAAMPLLGPQHFLMPFLAHALGTFVGSAVAASIAASRKLLCAMIIGVLTLAGGIAAAFMIPAPVWFIAVDLIAAYIPMSWLGWKIADR